MNAPAPAPTVGSTVRSLQARPAANSHIATRDLAGQAQSGDTAQNGDFLDLIEPGQIDADLIEGKPPAVRQPVPETAGMSLKMIAPMPHLLGSAGTQLADPHQPREAPPEMQPGLLQVPMGRADNEPASSVANGLPPQPITASPPLHDELPQDPVFIEHPPGIAVAEAVPQQHRIEAGDDVSNPHWPGNAGDKPARPGTSPEAIARLPLAGGVPDEQVRQPEVTTRTVAVSANPVRPAMQDEKMSKIQGHHGRPTAESIPARPNLAVVQTASLNVESEHPHQPNVIENGLARGRQNPVAAEAGNLLPEGEQSNSQSGAEPFRVTVVRGESHFAMRMPEWAGAMGRGSVAAPEGAESGGGNTRTTLAPPVDQGIRSGRILRSVQLRLEPATLGQVTVELRRDGSMLHVRLEPEQAATAQMLRSDASRLNAVLQTAGILPEAVTVQIVEPERGAQGNGASGAQGHAPQEQNQFGGRPSAGFGQDSDDADAGLQANEAPHGDQDEPKDLANTPAGAIGSDLFV